MKSISVVYTIVLAATVYGAALPNAEADPFCNNGRRIGCPFGKRNADALPAPEAEANPFCNNGRRIGCPFGKRMADALAAPEAEANPFCNNGRRIGCPFGKREAEAHCSNGGPCEKNKRAAEAVAEAFAEPMPSADPFCNNGRRIGCPFGKRDEAEAFCNLPGEACSKAKRSAEELAEAVAAAHPDSTAYHAALVMREAFPEPEAAPCAGTECDLLRRDAEAFCNTTGGACAKVKRAAEAIAEALAEPSAEADPFCNNGRRIGCPFGKREAKAEDFCDTPGQACSIARRDASAMAAAAAHALASL